MRKTLALDLAAHSRSISPRRRDHREVTASFHENSNARWKPGAMSLASEENELQYAAEDVAAEILRA
jgi:hypothetical protein